MVNTHQMITDTEKLCENNGILETSPRVSILFSLQELKQKINPMDLVTVFNLLTMVHP